MKLRRDLTAIALGLSTVAAFAQTGTTETRQIKEEGKTVFNPHWFMQVQGGVGYTVGEADFGDLISPAAALNFGYQFTPVWGLRFGVSGWQAKGGWVNPATTYKYNYLQGNVDVMLDLGNLFCGYKADRLFNPYFFVGVGLNGAFNNDDATALKAQGYELSNYWDKNFNIEANANVMSDKFNSKKAGNPDWQFNALAGFTFKFGKPSRTTEPVYYEPTPTPPPAPAPVKEEPAPAPVVEEVKPMTQNVFFKINSAEIRTSEENKIASLVSYLKEHSNAKVSLCGYADKQTGNARINERLSKERAEAVAEALKAQGIAESRITVDYKGDTAQPFGTAEENRVTICIAE